MRTRVLFVVLFVVALLLAGSLDWSAGEPPVTVVAEFEDGSFVLSDGTVGCRPGALCDDN